MGRTIEVVDQTLEWSAFFEKEAAHLAVIFGTQLVVIHHIGSTAIPGIKAKPIIDILVVIKHIKTIETFNAHLRHKRSTCSQFSVGGNAMNLRPRTNPGVMRQIAALGHTVWPDTELGRGSGKHRRERNPMVHNHTFGCHRFESL